MQDLKQEARTFLKKISVRNGSQKVPRIMKVEVHQDRNLTAAIINSVFFGWSKFNPNDQKFSTTTGVSLALYRACQKLYISVNS